MKLRHLGPIPDTGHAIRKKHAKKVAIADQNLICFSLACESLMQCGWDSWVVDLLVQDLFFHFKESARYAVKTDAKMALSLLRIATERYRDLSRIIEDESLADVYETGRTKENMKAWRASFKFKLPADKFVKDWYDYCCNAVHTAHILGEHTGEVKIGDGNFVVLSQKNQAIDVLVIVASLSYLCASNLMIASRERLQESKSALAMAQDWKIMWDGLESENNHQMVLLSKRTSMRTDQ